MSQTPEDAYLRYDHVRSKLAEVDRSLRQSNLDGFCMRALPAGDGTLEKLADLLGELASCTRDLTDAADELAAALLAH